ncbi:MAG: lysylphosphatidylglycerol synthase transmembrane domain-containing protein [Methylohalobius crimeensis]
MNLATERREDIALQFRSARIALPLLIGLSLAGYLIYEDINRNGAALLSAWNNLSVGWGAAGWLCLAVLLMILREAAYMVQLRILTDRRLSWRAAMEVMLLWDFFAAVSPSVVGGAAVAVFMLVKERLGVGRGTAVVFTNILLDEIFYLAMLPLGLWMVGYEGIFRPLTHIDSDWVSAGMLTIFWSAYGAISAYVLLLGASLFVWPRAVNRLLRILFMFRIFKRWRRWGLRTARDLFITSVELRDRSTGFWLQLWAVTGTAWLARYLVLNCLLAAFATQPLGWEAHVLAFARQAALFIVMVVSPTPGSAGVAEVGFTLMFADMAPLGLVLPLALLWRTVSYYPYLLIGVPMMSRWLKRVYGSA